MADLLHGFVGALFVPEAVGVLCERLVADWTDVLGRPPVLARPVVHAPQMADDLAHAGELSAAYAAPVRANCTCTRLSQLDSKIETQN